MGATGVFLNVTPVSAQADGFISVRPATAGGTPPTTSNVNVSAGEINPNSVLVELPTTWNVAGKIDITYDAYGTVGPTTDILIDVLGYLAPEFIPTAGQAGGNQAVALTAADQTVRYWQFFPPQDGTLIVNSSATVQALSPNEGVARCSITTGNTIDFDYAQMSSIEGWGSKSLSGTRGFDVTAGVIFRVNLVCDKSLGDDVKLFDSSLTAMYFPMVIDI